MYDYTQKLLFIFKLCYNLPETSTNSMNENMLSHFVINGLNLAMIKREQIGGGIEKSNVSVVGDFNYPDISWDNLSPNSNHKNA